MRFFNAKLQHLAALLIGLALVAVPGDDLAGPAGPRESQGDGSSPAPSATVYSAREAWHQPHQTVASDMGVHQRLLHPTDFRRHDTHLPDFVSIKDVQTRKVEFFRFLKPLVEEENHRLLQIRKRLGYIQDHLRFKRPLKEKDRLWLEQVTEDFGLGREDFHTAEFWQTLLRRVDMVPEELVLIQAANESAWGTSRFAREGNNLFGQWCFRPGCGMVPAGRPLGARHEVAAFASISDSIRSYLNNLNTGRVYHDLRVLREQYRRDGHLPEAAELAAGLSSYSERGMAYVQDIRAMLRHNAPVLAQLDNP